MATSLFHPDLSRYLDVLVPARPSEMMAMEVEAERTDFPIIGPAAGYFCYLIARLIGARSVFELGSGFGYSMTLPPGWQVTLSSGDPAGGEDLFEGPDGVSARVGGGPEAFSGA